MKEVVLKYFQENNRYITESELRKKLNKENKKIVDLKEVLNDLVEEGILFFCDKHGYRLFTNELGIAFGEIEINKSGNGFVHTNDGYTIFIDKNDLNGSLNGDKVIVDSIIFGKENDFKGEIQKVVKRRDGNVIFEVVGNGYQASLVPYNVNDSVLVHINKNEYKDLMDGQIIRVTVGTQKIDDEYKATIEEVIGHKTDPGIDLKLIYAKNNVLVEFSDDVLLEAKKIPQEVFEKDLVGRIDLRDKKIITIDCDDTKDMDDAVYIERLPKGGYKLYVSISHVSYYVKPDTALYNEAKIRCTSHYPNNTCNPMFPRILSNGICSLNEKVDRLTRTVEMDFDSNGKIVDYNIYLSVINVKKNMKYSNVNKLLNGEEVDGYTEYTEQLCLMNELSTILEKNKNERNYLDFDIPDLKVLQNKEGKIEGITELKQGNAEKIIENFMLVTGTTVSEHYSWMPFIYRVHESPNQETVQNIIKTLTLSGFKIPKCKNIDEYTIKEILERINTKEEAIIIKTLLLKSMKRARYDTNAIGHFALQLPHYCHFTSPIRRFADFRIHTIIDAVDTFDYTHENIKKLESDLVEVASSTSKMEKTAQSIENEALMMAMAEYMQNHIGESFSGIVTEVYSHGMFVRTENFISGKVKFEDMGDDKFKYDYDKRAIIGKGTNKKYQIGNKVYVIVKDASKEKRIIDFMIDNSVKKKVLK